ncbi:MAG TPA: penicillin-binding protein 2, partial [Bdellovibrionota bacterium]|nr:penicillin-binding protein 2 [Bdellovibrionota bacterium]
MIPHGQSSFFQRLTYIGWFQVFVVFVIVIRLFILQVLYSDEYKTLAEENRTRIRVNFAPRGYILDRWGDPIVKNIKSYNALIVPQECGDLSKALETMTSILNLSSEEKNAILKKAKIQPRFIPLSLKTNLNWDQVAKLELHNTEFPGIYTEEGRARDYLLNDHASHVIGYISSPSRKEAEKNKLFMMPGAKIGKNGIEGYYEQEIRGEIGQRSIEVNARGRIIRELKNTAPKSGNNFYLTLDKELQDYVSNLLAPYKSAAAIVLDVHTGEVLSMVSSPGYTPSLFFNGIAHEPWKQLVNSPYAPMINKVISGQYSPGSAFKVVIALAILEAGISPEEKISCPGFMMLGKHRFHCWQHHGHGAVNLAQALAQSCDVYFYQMMRRLKIENVLKIAQKLGVHQKTGIDLEGEQEGFIATPEWKRKVKKEPWYAGDSVLTAIGQGYVLMTPLQMVTMMAQLANGGYKIRPHLKLQKPEAEASGKESLDLNPNHIQFVLNGLSEGVNDPKGTSYRARITEEKYKMGGKTSTAQVRRISMQERLEGVRQ